MEVHQLMDHHQAHQTQHLLSKIVIHKEQMLVQVPDKMEATLLMQLQELVRQVHLVALKIAVGTCQLLKLPNQLLRIRIQMPTEQLDIM